MNRLKDVSWKWSLRCVCLVFLALSSSWAQTNLAPDLRANIDDIARQILATTGVPSSSLAVVKDGEIAYLQAYGNARLDPPTPARPEMRYSIGSISKQFTATAILMLAEEGKLSLDDPVSKYVSGLTRGNEVTIRELLSHTSGYQDYWPQDYVMPMMLKPVTPEEILDRWGRIPLDFDPGTKWQYSNTNYVIAGVIVEKVSGMPLWVLLGKRVFTPLGMSSIADTNEKALPATDPGGYFRYALGPLHPAPKEGKGWMFAAGELAMTAKDLAKWDISIIDQAVLKPASYKEMETVVLLKNGAPTRYGLGIGVSLVNGHRVLEHGGEVSGFTADNIVMPDDKMAIVVLTNQDAAEAASQIGSQIRSVLLKSLHPEDQKEDVKIRKVYEGLQQGKIDRALFTDNANYYFNDQALRDYASSLGPLGAPQSFTSAGASLRGGMTERIYEVKYSTKNLVIIIYEMPDGKLEQYLIAEK
ncbi:MAG TPA: serine hydrolase domain-containing protein [Terriglobales bacterium]|nr:serine hydrolase domain-containing protein [Terriglobales bacterium]